MDYGVTEPQLTHNLIEHYETCDVISTNVINSKTKISLKLDAIKKNCFHFWIQR